MGKKLSFKKKKIVQNSSIIFVVIACLTILKHYIESTFGHYWSFVFVGVLFSLLLLLDMSIFIAKTMTAISLNDLPADSKDEIFINDPDIGVFKSKLNIINYFSKSFAQIVEIGTCQ